MENEDVEEESRGGSTVSSSLQCEASPNLLSSDTPIPTAEDKQSMIGMSKYKAVKQWRTIWSVQWFRLDDTAWSGHAGRIVFPKYLKQRGGML